MSRVYIGRLSYRAREKDVERFFKGYGKILEVDLKNGYGFVEFDDPRDADDAVYDLNGKELCGERVIVEHTRGPRRDGGYGGGGGGRDRYGPPIRTDYRLIVENLSSRCSWQDLKVRFVQILDCLSQALLPVSPLPLYLHSPCPTTLSPPPVF
uniref:Serine and arginine rich splicing factor 4 n=1 Tax=Amphilophus citrinellus TaxID=61819 RepID=A0A3Q0SVL0_AMPCI